jgi:hypothetical protein
MPQPSMIGPRPRSKLSVSAMNPLPFVFDLVETGCRSSAVVLANLRFGGRDDRRDQTAVVVSRDGLLCRLHGRVPLTVFKATASERSGHDPDESDTC